jgi:hypothetical protein
VNNYNSYSYHGKKKATYNIDFELDAS